MSTLPLTTVQRLISNLSQGLKLDRVLTDPIIQDGTVKVSFMDLFARQIASDFKGDQQKIDLLLLESELPCKQQQFELQFAGSGVEGSVLGKLKAQLENLKTGDLDQEGFKMFVDGTIQMLAVSFSALHEEWDRDNLTFEKGVPVKFSRDDNERSMTACTHTMALVKKALDDPKNSGKDPRQIERQVWNGIKMHIDETKRELAGRQRATERQMERDQALEAKRLAAIANAKESSFGLGPNPPEPTGQGRTRRRRRKGNKTKARKVKRGSRR